VRKKGYFKMVRIAIPIAGSCEEKLSNTVLKRSMFLVDVGCGIGRAFGMAKGAPPGTCIAVEVFKVRLPEIRSRTCFRTTVLNSEIIHELF
jgi:tRNA G46 methylase TrmB